ncbi:acyltransferase [Mycobacterium decipiens]|uniref:Acyltransferase n=1 Tax=Mycobacterium decipiens TaxID=1430326 RepID=A0A1X2LRY7_9MYCO|nr:condensation domain-containing protein [Mycobacterium decipiens]OSC39404.1 acyltransferase [Mycobacterium decipiens]
MIIGGGSADVSLGVGTVYDWEPGPGPVVTWQPTPSSLAKARQAPVVPAPPSSMQAGHLRGYVEFGDRGLDYSRVVMGSWDIPGKCDIRAMTHVINGHLRRHETYRSWFEYKDAQTILRHKIANPRDIQFVPVQYGELTQAEWRDLILSTPSPLEWDCFKFGLIQREDHFAFFAFVDHLHCDPALITGLYVEVLTNYQALVAGKPPVALPPTASHEEFCTQERAYAETMTLDSPEVRKWIEFAENNGGGMPDFPLPLGDQSIPCGGDIMVVPLMDPDQTAHFESACISAGARFSGGLFACTALAHHELTGQETYYGLTPIDRRKSPAEYMTMGWFTGIVPFTVPIDPSSFEETARATQASFDENIDLANVPYDRVLELAPWLKRYGPQFTMMNYMDAGLPPLSAVVATALKGANATAYNDGRSPAYLYMSVIRLFDEVSLMISFPNNPIARESATRYGEVISSIFSRVAAGRYAASPVRVSS